LHRQIKSLEMLEAFQKFVKEQKLFINTQKILLAVSGGIDSVAMAHLFYEAKIDFGIAHCNFSLRGNDSNLDQAFVENLAIRYQVPFFTIQFDTILEAANRKISIQMAARELRYEWFSNILTKHYFDCLATAHHANDVLETVIINLARGTGIAGMHGILPVNNQIIRPLLFATRENIEQYVNENKLQWREDSSNNSDKYARNLIRHKIVPVLKQLNANIVQTTLQTTTKLRQTEEAFLFSLAIERRKFETETEGVMKLQIAKLLALPEAYFVVIMSEYSFLFEQASNIFKIISSPFQAGKTFLSSSHTLIIDRFELIIYENKEIETISILINEPDNEIELGNSLLKLAKINAENYKIDPKPEIAGLDYHKLKFPIEIRSWQTGDSFIPFGMKGRKKVSDFLIDIKISIFQKSQIKVLVSNNEIAWVIGIRISETFKITSNTKYIYNVEIMKSTS